MKMMVVARGKINSDEMHTLGLYALSCNRVFLGIFHVNSRAQKVPEGVGNPFHLFHESICDLAMVQHSAITR